MKQIHLFLIVLFILTGIFSTLSGQTTITLCPDGTTGKDAFVRDIAPTTNFGTNAEFGAAAWTYGGTDMITRTFIDFDFSSIPSGATILSANLYLYNYANAQTNNGEHSQLNGTNELVVQRVTGTWDNSTINWSNKPTTTTLNQVIVPASTSIHQDYNIDVTALTQDIINNTATSHGFMFKLQTEIKYRCVVFASSNVTDPSLRPKLVITYSESNENCITIRPNSQNGKDAFVRDIAPTTNFGTNPEFGAAAWTYSGTDMITRTFIDFDFSSIPSGATILSSNLYLYNYANAQTNNGEHSQLNGTNELVVQRVTGIWDNSTINWNNKPTTSTLNQVLVPASSSIHQDYNIDVTGLTQDIIDNSATSHGFMFKLQTEVKYRCVVFAASEVADTNLAPKIVICYKTDIGVHNPSLSDNIKIYPNPATDKITISNINNSNEITATIIDLQGKIISEHKFFGQNYFDINVNSLSKGIYFLKMQTDNKIEFGRFIKY